MTCFACERNLSAYIDDELTNDFRLEMESHLESCERCRRDYETHFAAWEAAGLLRAVDPPEGLYEGIESEIRKQRPGATVDDLALIVRGLAGELRDLKQAVEALRQDIEPARQAAEKRRPARSRDRLRELQILSAEPLNVNQ